MWKDLGDREAGKLRPYSFSNRITSDRIASLQLSNYKEIVSPHRGAVNSLQRGGIYYPVHQMHQLLFMIFNVPQNMRGVVWLQNTRAFLLLTSNMSMDTSMLYPQPYGIPLTQGCSSRVHMIITSMFGIQIPHR